MKKTLLSLAVIGVLGFSGCGSSSDSAVATTDVTVERGPVYNATVKDATGKIAQQKTGENVYTFTGDITYPITVNGGWIDVDGDGAMSTKDIELNMELKSYSDVVTPVTTYIADPSEEKREEKLQALLALVNSDSDTEVTSEDLLKVASQTTPKAQGMINAVYAEMLDSNSSEINTDDILGRINDFENIDMPENISAKDRAEMYEEYLVNNSDIANLFTKDKLDANDITMYEMPVLDITSISKDSKSIVILNDYPLEAFNQLENQYASYEGLTFYRASNNTTTCSKDFSGYSYCNEISLSDSGYATNYTGEKVSVIGVYDIPNYAEDTSDAGINDIVGKAFYSIDKEDIEDGNVYYYEIMIDSLIPMEESGVDYYLSNGEWVVETYYEDEDDNDIISIDGNKLKTVYTDTYNGVTTTETIYISIAEKTSTYWTMKFEYSDTDGYSDVMYDKWYLSPTTEMLDPSKIEVGSYNAPSKSVARINKMKRKIFGMLVK